MCRHFLGDQPLASSLAYTDYDGSISNKGEFLANSKQESLRQAQIITIGSHQVGKRPEPTVAQALRPVP